MSIHTERALIVDELLHFEQRFSRCFCSARFIGELYKSCSCINTQMFHSTGFRSGLSGGHMLEFINLGVSSKQCCQKM